MSVRSVTPLVESHGLVILNSEKGGEKKAMKKTDEELNERVRLWLNWSKHDKNSSVASQQRHGAVGAIVKTRVK